MAHEVKAHVKQHDSNKDGTLCPQQDAHRTSIPKPTTTSNTTDASTHMDMEDKTIEGGINDDDLSKQMIQNWEDSNSTESVMSTSPEANRKKND